MTVRGKTVQARNDWRPVPDPTDLTTEQLREGLSSLKEILETRINSVEKSLLIMDQAIIRRPLEVQAQIDHLKELHGERFSSISLQFNERDVRATASENAAKEAQTALSTASTTAVNAALQAQKESAFATQQFVAESARKSEAGFISEINSLKALINSTKEATIAQMADLRSRLDRGEGSEKGVRDQRSDNHMTVGSIVGIVGGIVSVLSLISVIIFSTLSSNLARRDQQPPTIVSPAVIPVNPR